VASRSGTKRSSRMIVVDAAGGLSGDMFLAGLFALGADPKRVAREVRKLRGLEPFTIRVERVNRGGIAATRATVRSSGRARERDLASILDMIGKSRLGERVKELSAKTFRIIGAAEGKVHGVAADHVHFHEVGAVDSIVDIVGGVAALETLGFPPLFHRPLRLGSGFVEFSHGRHPVPAPATIEILRGRTVILDGGEGEVVTPTGAALMKALAEELPELAPLVPRRVVYAAGTRDTGPEPGMLRLVEADGREPASEITVLRTTIDDMNPELYGWVTELLFGAGALDVFLTQVIMKKGRPGVLLTALCEGAAAEALLEIIFRETTTLGVRVSRESRAELERWTEKVDTAYGPVQVKRARLRDGSVKTSPEYASCRDAAESRRVPIAEAYEAARRGRTRTARAARSIGARGKRPRAKNAP
jgi:pyridinium-3,5-bisthiocarboxylic acid mononucleotide nickel chelatase